MMHRTLADDLKWALAVFVGALLAYLVFAPDDASVLLGAFVGIVLVVLVLNLLRAVWRRRHVQQ